jgi:hypothetical protein
VLIRNVGALEAFVTVFVGFTVIITVIAVTIIGTT